MNSFTLVVIIGSTLGALISVVSAVLAVVSRKKSTRIALDVGKDRIVLSANSSFQEIESARLKFSQSLEALKR